MKNRKKTLTGEDGTSAAAEAQTAMQESQIVAHFQRVLDEHRRDA